MYLLYPVDTLAFRYKMSSAGLHYYHPYVPDSYFGYFIGKLSNREENIFCHLYAVDKNTIFVQNFSYSGDSREWSSSSLHFAFQSFFEKMGQSRPLFVYFRPFLNTISIIQIEKSIDGVLGTQTSGHMMVGTDDTTELWWPPRFSKFKRANEIIENSVRGISLCFKKYFII